MSEAYLVEGNTLLQILPNQWAGETFIPLETHILEYIDLELMRWADPSDHLYEIYATDLNGLPSGSPISQADSVVYPWKGITYLGRFRFHMTPVQLNRGTRYALIIRVNPRDPIFAIHWQYEKSTGAYPRGYRLFSGNNGITWHKYLSDDHIFAEFGYPPVVASPAPPPIPNFAILDLTYLHLDNALIIYLPTNVPCHMTCYYTDTPPLKHHRSRTIRGLKVPWGTYFCFVAWQEIEQIEIGDTLYHTFIIPSWPQCTHVPIGWDLAPGLSPPYWEPWGTFLTENHPWILIPEHDPPEYHLNDGLLTLISTNYESRGTRCDFSEPHMPLHNSLGSPLSFNAHFTHTDGNPLTHSARLFLYTTNAADSYHIRLIISRGNLWATFRDNQYALPLIGGIDYGQGPHLLNLPELWTQLRVMAGLPSDPTGWTLDYIRTELLQEPIGGTITITNDYINLFYPIAKDIPPYGNERYFTFRGKVDNIDSPSVGPIFKHCLPGQDLIANPSFELFSNPPNPPDLWTGGGSPGRPPDFHPFPTDKTHGLRSCKATVDNLYAIMNLRQNLNPAHLSDLQLSFVISYNGALEWFNGLRIRAWGDTFRLIRARPTLDYQWEDLIATITMPSNLYRLEFRAGIDNQGQPVPWSALWDNCRVYLGTPP